jgi:2-hydroxycyclohexanecarboxyl-CoA dehydrogenase
MPTERVAVVTGGGSGIGRATCVQLAREGAAVAVWDLDALAANETVSLIHTEGGQAEAFIGDAADRGSIETILADIRSRLGRILILVNNAGISQFKSFLDVSEQDFDRVFHINVKGPFVLTQLVAPDMLAAKWGRIIFISSSSAQTGTKIQPHYSASKGAIISLTRSLAETFAADGITVNNVPPGFIDTPMLRGVDLDVDAVAQLSPMKRAGKPEELAAAVCFLASEAAGYITGQTLGVNGGRVVS